jgi:hypothetical protein
MLLAKMELYLNIVALIYSLPQIIVASGISYADPTEVVQEAVIVFSQEDSTVYQCFYDLEKASGISFCITDL